MLNYLDIGRQVMPSNPTGGWLMIGAALAVGAAVIMLARHSRAVLAARALLLRERDIDEAVAWAEEEPPRPEEDLDAVPAGRSRQIDLARTNLMLLIRQLAFIDELKAHESDPDTFADLDRLEQLTQQMRRNCASVMVVAGFDPTRTHHRHMPASELLSQALSGIEQSARVTLSMVDDPDVPPHLSAALMHLVAEVIDNATRFSEPTSTVMVLVSHTEGGLRIRVADDGAGIGPEKLAELNDLIADPPTGGPQDVEAVAVRGLGLAAVGRIAQRIGAEVTLSSSIGRGTVASIDQPLTVAETDVELPGVGAVERDSLIAATGPGDPVPAVFEPALPEPAIEPVLLEPVLLEPAPLEPVGLEPVDLEPFREPEVFAPIEVALDTPPSYPQPRPHHLLQPQPVLPAPVPAMPPPMPAPGVAPAETQAPVWRDQAEAASPVPAPRPDEPVENLSGISWLSAEEPAPTHAAAEAGIRPPAPWDLDDDPNPSTALAIDVLPRRKTLLPGKNRPKPEE